MIHPSRPGTARTPETQARRGEMGGSRLAPVPGRSHRHLHPENEPPMRAIRSLMLFLVLLGATALGGCSDLLPDDGDTDRAGESDLIFARADPDAPPLDALEVSFWAKPGQTRSAAINYVGIPVGKYRLCMEFVVPAGALLRHPDGRAVQPGDSVRITVRAVDPDAFRFEFAPKGLRFDPANPARLRVSYWWADRDYDGDGRRDKTDEAIEEALGIWRQETPGAAWERVATERLPEIHEVRASVPGFTRYAVASTRGAAERERSD